jgi:hypothetical protein
LIAYFIMGRSENSRNRVFCETADGIRTKAFDPAKLTDPSLVIYHPVRLLGNDTIVTNGDQTDTIYEGLRLGKSFAESLESRTFEPDPPIYTPRISGLVSIEKGQARYELSILKSADGDPTQPQRFHFAYETALPGIGHLIHTYQEDGNPPPSFIGEPRKIEIPEDPNTFGETLWQSLNPQNKVSLYIRVIDIASGAWTGKIFNRHI